MATHYMGPVHSPISTAIVNSGTSPQSVAPPTKSSNADRTLILPLTGVRALAAIWVVAGHFLPNELNLFPAFRFIDSPLRAASLGVDLFFVLSGFILALNYLEQFAHVERKSYFRFLWLRLARIYPVHLFTLLFLLAAVLAARHAHLQLSMPERLQPREFVTNLFLIHAWTFKHPISWNGPAWSISAEWFAYLLFPLFAGYFLLVRSPRAALLAVFTAFAIMLGGFTAGIDHPLFRVACDFAAGCFLYRLYSFNWRPHWPWARIALGAIALTVVLTYAHPMFRLDSEKTWAAPLMAILVFAIASSSTGLSRVLSTRPALFLGAASYSLYMTHDLVRLVLTKILPTVRYADRGIVTRLAVFGFYFAALAILSIGTYLVVEVKCRNWMRSVLHRGAPKEQIAAGLGAVSESQSTRFDGDCLAETGEMSDEEVAQLA